jgi:hypothetical protein
MKNFLAVYTGTPSDAPPAMDPAEMAKGMAAWGQWMQGHGDAVVFSGGPLGRTKRVSKAGTEDIRNPMAGFVVVKADDQAAAAKMFEGHPHFSIFPGDGVEIMEVLPIPGAPG